MPELIDPRVLKGFRDFLPGQEHERLRIMHLLQTTFGSFGFVPIDTPMLEYTEILLGKGGGETDKQVYRFQDQGGRDVALRFDLTVPFARFMAAHVHELYLPFKRFHIAKVFRGENTQRGRYREFVQCDFDIVGTDSASADFEIVLMIDQAFRAMGVRGISIRLAHRGIFNALLETLGIAGKSEDVLRAVDKLRKVGEKETGDQLTSLVGAAHASTVMEFICEGPSNDDVLRRIARLVPSADQHVQRLRAILAAARDSDLAERVVLDPSITRGLDYYTGMVFETFLNDLPEIGSVCSGGRYDNLASLYTRERIPGVGGSIGLDRLMAALESVGLAAPGFAAADVLVACVDESLMGTYHDIGQSLRRHGIRVEVFPEPRKLGQQFAFAEKKGIPVAVICGPEEAGAGTVNVRDLATRENSDGLTPESAVTRIREILERGPTGDGAAETNRDDRG